MLEHADCCVHYFLQARVLDHFRQDANRFPTSGHLHTSNLTSARCGMK